MHRNVWLMNHYATQMFFDKAGRHYWFAKELKKRGYEPIVFCANTFLKDDRIIDIDNGLSKVSIDEVTGVPYVFVKTKVSIGNGIDRVLNMLLFGLNLRKVALKMAKNQKPNIIIASSVHPFTMVAGILIGKKIKVPCICEIRDLWPEAIFAFGKAKETSVLGKILIAGEHWIYKNADALIFTKEGDTDYLKERRWTKEQGGDIDLDKCYYINNGVDIADNEARKRTMVVKDVDLDDENKFNVTYIGTIRAVNNVGNLLDAAKIISSKEIYRTVQFLIYGEGNQLEELKNRVMKENIQNVKFKGYINRQYVPYILSKSSINILNYSQNQYNWSRGNSSNKLFEYMASGKPIISTVKMGYSIIDKYKCGVELDQDSPENLAEEIIKFYEMDRIEYDVYGENAKKGAKEFDFVNLTDKLLRVINEVLHA